MIIEDKDYESPFGDVFTSGLRHQKIDSNTYGNFNTEEFLFHYNEFLSAYDKIFNEAIKDSKRQMAYWTKEDFASLAKKLDDNDALKKKAEELVAYYQRSGVKQAIPEFPSLIDFINQPNAKHSKLSPKDLVQIHERIVNKKAQLDPFQPYWEKLNANQWKNSRGLASIRSEYQQNGSNFSEINSEGTKGKEAVLATLRSNKMLKWVHSKEDYDKNIAKGQPTFYEEKGIFHIHYGQQSSAALKELCNATLIGARKALQQDQITVFDNIENPVELRSQTLMSDREKAEIETKVFGGNGILPPDVKRNVDARMAVINERGAYDLENGQRVTRAGYRAIADSEAPKYQERYTDVLLDEKNKYELKEAQTHSIKDEKFVVAVGDAPISQMDRKKIADTYEKVAKTLGYSIVKSYAENGDLNEVQVFSGEAVQESDRDLFKLAVEFENNKETQKRSTILNPEELTALKTLRCNLGGITSAEFQALVKHEVCRQGYQAVLSETGDVISVLTKTEGLTNDKKREFQNSIKTGEVPAQNIIDNNAPQVINFFSQEEQHYMRIEDVNAQDVKRLEEIALQLGCSVQKGLAERISGARDMFFYHPNMPSIADKLNQANNQLFEKESNPLVVTSGSIKDELKSYTLEPEQLDAVIASVAQEKGFALSYTEHKKGNDAQLKSFTVSVPDKTTFTHAVRTKIEKLYPDHKPASHSIHRMAAGHQQNEVENPQQRPNNPLGPIFGGGQ